MANSPGRTSRILACVLVALGAFLLTCAALLPTYTKSHALKTPLNLEVTIVSDGKGSVLDVASLAAGAAHVDKDVPLTVQRFVTVEDPSNADIMTVQSGQTLRRTDKSGDAAVVNALVDRVTVDRKTSMPTNDPVGTIQTQPGRPGIPVERQGLQYKWPFDVQKQTYPYFDVTARTTNPIDFVDQTEINGMKVYKFHQVVPVTDLSKTAPGSDNLVSLPAKNWGLPGDAPVTMHRYYTDDRTMWVDPVTGTIIKSTDHMTQYFGRTADERALTVLDMNVSFNEATIEYQINQAKDGQDKISLFTRILPLVALIVGLIALIGGVILGLRSVKKQGVSMKKQPAAGGSGDPAFDNDETQVIDYGRGAAGEQDWGEANTEIFPAAGQHETKPHENGPNENGPDDQDPRNRD